MVHKMLFCLLGYISILLTLFCLFYFFSYITCSCSLISHVQYLFLPFETAAVTKICCRGGQEMDVHVNLFLIMQSRWCVDGDSSSSFCKVFHAVFQHKFFYQLQWKCTTVVAYPSSSICGITASDHLWGGILLQLLPVSCSLLYNGNPVLGADVVTQMVKSRHSYSSPHYFCSLFCSLLLMAYTIFYYFVC